MFEIGKEYKRKEEIHGVYGGQAQGGISTPKNHPVVFIFTSDSGEQHGYRDEYHEDGLFWYTGEGQIGDMKMVSGNKAIFEHTISGKAIHVFEYIRKAYVRYIGSAECLGYHEEDRPDRDGNNRTAFVFHLDIDSSGKENTVAEPKATFSPESPKQLKNKSIKDLRKAALNQSSRTSTPKVKQEIAYYRSLALKLYVIARSKGICEGCGASAPFQTKSGPYLECHHVHRLADGGPDHPENVVALCPNCHRRAHFSNDAQAYNETLKKVAHEAEQNSL
ncbi:HNH endonuclease [Pseudoalteromonas sp. S2721]|uniref:HNH endonuclease n=1 Tax=Pseudoalteromonas sp. S2721 TaxID=579526 RepID=UPI00110BB63B|nr:HNH endonuclease [Pseudoalteromonas sp. S2721]TMP20422.1 HNH endonuclease [Pseudoalteromonas sp. S2721]